LGAGYFCQTLVGSVALVQFFHKRLVAQVDLAAQLLPERRLILVLGDEAYIARPRLAFASAEL